MTTRAIQIGFMLSNIIDPNTGLAVESGTVYFYAAGTTTAKNVWTEKEKTNPYTQYDLSAVGTAQLYGEGNYKVVVKNSADVTVLTLDNIRLEFPYYGIRTITETGSQVSQDDFILVNTTGGAVTINALAAASWTRPLKVMRISGSNAITFEPSGAETIDSAANLSWNSDAIVEIISDASNLRTAGFRSSFADADNDTKIQVEESSDEDKIRFDTGGTQRAVLDEYGLHAVLADNDGDTKIQVEESADEDKIRIDTGGTERVVVDSNGLDVVSGALRVGSTSITSTPAEINELHSQGAVAADFAKLHAIGASAAEIDSRTDGVPAMAAAVSSGDVVLSTSAQTLASIQLAVSAGDVIDINYLVNGQVLGATAGLVAFTVVITGVDCDYFGAEENAEGGIVYAENRVQYDYIYEVGSIPTQFETGGTATIALKGYIATGVGITISAGNAKIGYITRKIQ